MESWNMLFEKSKYLPQSVRNKYLIKGIKERDEFLVELALHIGAEVNVLYDNLYPIEHVCEVGCSDEILNLLIDAGANASVRGSSALVTASIKRYQFLVKPLVNAGCNVSVSGDIALRLAISYLDYDLIDYLLLKGANINNCYNQIVAVIDRIDSKTFDSFIKYGLDLELYGSKLMIEATRASRINIIKSLATNLNFSGYIDSLLRSSVRSGDPDTVQFYVDNCKEIPEGILDIAVKRGYTSIVKILIKAGVDVTAEDNLALCLASIHGCTSIANLLLKAGADATARNNEPIREAHARGFCELEKLLISYGADIV